MSIQELHTPPRQTTANESRSKRASILIVVSLILLSEVASFEYNMVSPALPNIAAHFGTPNVGLVFTAAARRAVWSAGAR